MQLTVRDVSTLLSVSEKTIYRWVKQGVLPAYRVNEQYRFNRAELLEWATSRRMNVSAALFEEPESNATPIPGLLEALRVGGIFYRLGGTDKESVLRAVVEHLRLPEEVDREFLLRVLLAREALQSTGIGDGIAIPHVRRLLSRLSFALHDPGFKEAVIRQASREEVLRECERVEEGLGRASAIDDGAG